jgi:N-acetylglucosaminyldiphosphoundecaprenol N-acetyl-beta-D-mannosaminyltransferase
LTVRQVLARLGEVTDETPYSYVVTPNVDHIVRLQESQESIRQLRPLYEAAGLCLCDSKILHMLARLRGVSLPVVPGSELTESMFDHLIHPDDRIAVVGGDDALLKDLKARYGNIEFIQHCPPMGLRKNAAARATAAAFIARSGARYTFIAVGSPQQEMIASEARDLPGAKGVALCIGASLEFLTGRVRRAPRLAQTLGLEWAHRLLSDPKRMWRRYLVEGPRIFLLTYRWDGPGRQSTAK